MVFERELEKQIADLEEKISVLLSCKNCPENKGGYICQKEYEDKCFAQKIQFIKELQEENAELEEKLENADYQLEGREVELKELNKKLSQAEADYDKMFWQKNEIISNLQEQIESTKWQIGEPIKGREIFARNIVNCNLLATYYSGAWRNAWNGAVIDFNKITMWRYTGFKNNGEEIDCKEIKEND